MDPQERLDRYDAIAQAAIELLSEGDGVIEYLRELATELETNFVPDPTVFHMPAMSSN